MIVLGIESSCDETAAAICSTDGGLLSHALHSQVAIHAEYGGVVPELASRDHVRWAHRLVRQALDEASVEKPDAVAYTAGPGLAPALMAGGSFASGLAFGWQVPLVPVHHMEGHLLAPMLEEQPPEFPFVALLVSGGHTMLVDVSGVGCYQLLGETRDDAVGEAFDKTAKLLGLGYPGGPEVAELALQGHAGAVVLPRPMMDRPGLEFSFSGLKTAVVQALSGSDGSPQARADIALAFEVAVAQTLTGKSRRALQHTGYARLVVAGGVGANRRLRASLESVCRDADVSLHYPRAEFCTDNAAMIAYVGLLRCQDYTADNLGRSHHSVITKPRWPISELLPPGEKADHAQL